MAPSPYFFVKSICLVYMNMFSRFDEIPAMILQDIKETRSVTMNIFRKKQINLFKSFVKIELSYVFTINMFSTAESCMELNYLIKQVIFFSC